jgi:hypothetical protein
MRVCKSNSFWQDACRICISSPSGSLAETLRVSRVSVSPVLFEIESITGLRLMLFMFMVSDCESSLWVSDAVNVTVGCPRLPVCRPPFESLPCKGCSFRQIRGGICYCVAVRGHRQIPKMTKAGLRCLLC